MRLNFDGFGQILCFTYSISVGPPEQITYVLLNCFIVVVSLVDIHNIISDQRLEISWKMANSVSVIYHARYLLPSCLSLSLCIWLLVFFLVIGLNL